MSMIQLRPTFRLQLRGELHVVQGRLTAALKQPIWKDRGQIFGDYAEFHVAETEQRYWSPHLAIHLEPLDREHQIQYRHTDGAELANAAEAESANRTTADRTPADRTAAQEMMAESLRVRATSVHVPDSDARTLLVGRFAPRQNVWMLIWIVYLAMAFIVFFAGVYASVQYWMNATPWALGIGLGAVSCIVTLHLVSMIGQSWSSDQMHELRQRLAQLLQETGQEPIDAN
jgi:hypothetical protein